MFWGISLESGKRYSQTVEQSFHISMAALNCKSCPSKESVTIMVEVEKACYPLCTLNPEKIPQQSLDYVFTEGEEVLFYTEGGDIEVHLTGYLIDDPNPVEYSSDEEESASNDASENDEIDNNKENSKEESSEEEEDNLESLISELDGLNEDNKEEDVNLWLPRSARKKQRKKEEPDLQSTSSSLTRELLLKDDNDDDEESGDEDWQPGQKRKISNKKANSKTKDVKKMKQDVDESAANEDEVKFTSPMKTKKKTGKDSSSGFPNGVENDNQEMKHDTDEKMDSSNIEDEQHEKKHLPGGTVIQDIVKGTGKKAKKGKQVSLYYKGTLKKSKKGFDECLIGEPFTFKLGDGEVILGWDAGVEGMHVGGKRRLIVPPSQGYGSKAMGLSIPANSTLVFVVELMKVH